MAFKHTLQGVAPNDEIVDSPIRHQAVVDQNNLEIRSLVIPFGGYGVADPGQPNNTFWQHDINPVPAFDAIAGRTPSLRVRFRVRNATSCDVFLTELVTGDEASILAVPGDGTPQELVLTATSDWLAQASLDFILRTANQSGFTANTVLDSSGLFELKV